MRTIGTLFTALLILAGLALPANAGETDATVYVGHGIFGGDLGLDDDLPVDVNVVGVGCVLTDFRFGDFAGPLALPPATYTIEIRLSDGACGGGVAISAPVPFSMNENVTVLAHVDAAGNPTASKFGNDVSSTATGEARLSVHHTAAAPAVDVWALFRDGSSTPIKAFANVINGDQGMIDIPSGKWSAALRPADESTIVLGPAGLNLKRGSLTNVYAVGDLGTGSLTLLVNRLRLDN